MDLELQGKVALVAASSKGLGRAIATELAREGADVMLTSRDREQLEEARKEVAQAASGRVACHPCDMTRPDDIADLLKAVHASSDRSIS